MIDPKEIQLARERISPYIRKTPTFRSYYLSTLCGGDVYLKVESLQITGSFKIRGAFNKLLSLSKEEVKNGIITASSGNHAQAIGLSAEKLNISAKIIVPTNTPKNKLDKIRKYNVELVLLGDNYDESEVKALEIAKKEKRTWISPYNDELIIAGQGTIVPEIFEALEKIDSILVPIGGGGLISGIAIATKNADPNTQVIGVQTEACPSMYESIKAGKIIDIEMFDSIADGVWGGIEKGSITFDITRDFVDEIVVVKEETIKRALSVIWKNEEFVTEASGAMAITPILDNPERFKDKIVVCVISGGNIDKELFDEIITHY
ncbi:MAG: threonine/serine dehydratase [Candidatus Heimdallarchaeota archaeon]|nr:threonine/serine dehydratase [Candidatus Heimdallarchaeota archaeon]